MLGINFKKGRYFGLDSFTSIYDLIPNFDLESFGFGISCSLVIATAIVFQIYILPLILRNIKSLIEKYFSSISKRNSPRGGEDK